MAIDIGRRQFISALGGAAAVWPRMARAQQPAKLPTIGFLGAGSASAWSLWTGAFEQRLRDLRWIKGRTIVIECRWADGHDERYAEIADEFVRLKVDIIMTSGSAVLAAKQATSVIPIVFALANDPVGSGLVASLARPGSNVTGLSAQSTDSASKRLELLRQVVPALRRLAIIGDGGYRGSVLEMGEVQTAAHALSLEVVLSKIQRAEDIAPAFELFKGRADGLYVCSDSLVGTNRIRIITLALGARLPAIWGVSESVDAGGLISYGANVPYLFGQAAEIVDKILRGAKPADIPVEQPTKFELVINLKTAKALDLEIPHNLLVIADEVIE